MPGYGRTSLPIQRPYQAQGSQFLFDRKRAILADEPGLGKTNQLIMAAEGRTLVLSPAMLSGVWSQELVNWRSNLDVTWWSYGGLCKRVQGRNANGRIVSKVIPLPKDHLVGPWDTIICDEAHYLKGRKANWTKVMHILAGRTERLYLATGTPLPNWGHEIFMTLRLLYPGDKRFTNYWRWVNDWFRTSKPPWGGTKVGQLASIRPRATPAQVAEAYAIVAEEWGIDKRWLRREQEDVLGELPPMTYQTIEVEMPAAQRRVYDGLFSDFAAKLPETGHEVVSWDGGGVHGKLLQCSTGLPTLDPEETASGKFDVLRPLLEHRTRPTILFCAYRATADALGRLVDDMGLPAGVVSSSYSMPERLATIDAFKRGEFRVLVGTVGTLGEGLTLTEADTCIFVERHPTPSKNEQARRRIRRFGQERPTLCIDLITKDTVDDKLAKLLNAKDRDSGAAITGFDLAAAAIR